MYQIVKSMHTPLFILAYSFFGLSIYAQENFVSMQNVIRYNEKTKLPKSIYNINSRQYSGTPEEIAKQYLTENKNLLGLKDNIEDLKVTEVKESPGGFHVGFIQNYKNIPVMRSETVVSINRQNKISMMVNGYKPNISLDILPKISSENAVSLAKQSVGAEDSKELFPSKSELMIYQDSVNIYHLVWRVYLFPLELGGEWLAS